VDKIPPDGTRFPGTWADSIGRLLNLPTPEGTSLYGTVIEIVSIGFLIEATLVKWQKRQLI
jgi:hypothetical protein